ncbi:MAG: hypothetical protein OXC45_07950, partial [Gemmatimonadetes bacterium]|nr:hypothetical protein [Gemmatimonadota bacterium]
MQITGIELDAVHVNHRGDWVFVHVLTDEGIRGVGEMRSGNNYAAQLAALRDLGESAKGCDPRKIEAFVSHYTSTERTKVELFALSAFEQALWDILGKSLNVPVHALLGGACRDEIRLYANINRATTDRSPEGFARNAA